MGGFGELSSTSGGVWMGDLLKSLFNNELDDSKAKYGSRAH